VTWIGSGGDNPAGRRLAFFLRPDLPYLYIPPREHEETSSEEQVILDTLSRHGALFLDDIEHITGNDNTTLTRGLWALVWKGRITNDGFEPVRNFHGLPQQASTMHPRYHGRRVPRWLRKEVSHRMSTTNSFASGRWTLVQVPSKISPEEKALGWASQLLDRYGVVTREIWAAERCAAPWSDVIEGLKALEVRGDAHRGYYLRGLSGTQFARAQAVDTLRDATQAEDAADATCLLVSACDPANPYGLLYAIESHSGEHVRFARTQSTYLVLRNGQPILCLTSAGANVTSLVPLKEDEIRKAVEAMLLLVTGSGKMARQRARLEVETWDGQPASRSSVTELLQRMGFQREPRAMVLWGFYANRLGAQRHSDGNSTGR
jgi:ATP-dependent Lhr-like helicase